MKKIYTVIFILLIIFNFACVSYGFMAPPQKTPGANADTQTIINYVLSGGGIDDKGTLIPGNLSNISKDTLTKWKETIQKNESHYGEVKDLNGGWGPDPSMPFVVQQKSEVNKIIDKEISNPGSSGSPIIDGSGNSGSGSEQNNQDGKVFYEGKEYNKNELIELYRKKDGADTSWAAKAKNDITITANDVLNKMNSLDRINMDEKTGWGTGNNNSTMSDPIQNPDVYKPADPQGTDKLKEMGQKIITIVNAVGVVVAVCTTIIIGMRYMFGSVEEKSQMKETMIPYLIGAALVFAIPTLVNIIYRFAISINNV